jgi:hypothetical protein
LEEIINLIALFLLGKTNDLFEQIRRNTMTPEQRAADAKEERQQIRILIFLILCGVLVLRFKIAGTL